MSEEITVATKHPHLCSLARKVFGDIVQDVYVTTYKYPHMDKQDVADDLAREVHSAQCEKEFGIDGLHGIVITFTNGRSVWMSTSEWATIVGIDMSDESVEIV